MRTTTGITIRQVSAFPVLFGAIFFTGYSPAAFASQTVTVCGRDDAPGGLNLATALAAGGDIVIRCPTGQQTIQLTRTRDVHGSVSIDGQGSVTLQGPVPGSLFNADFYLTLIGLTVENSSNGASAGGIVVGPNALVKLDNVTTQKSTTAYLVKDLIAKNSQFLNNGDPGAPQINSGVVNAYGVELHHVSFTGNSEHPIIGRYAPAGGAPVFSREVLIEDSVFSRNKFTTLLTDASVTIRKTKFEGNGTQPEEAAAAWDCCGGAVTLVASDANIANSEFRSNGSSGFGGAIYAIGSKLQITQSVLQANKARAGGAIMFWGYWPKVTLWNSDGRPEIPQLYLNHAEFLYNSATLAGGGLLFSGTVEGNSVLFRANKAKLGAGAIADWRSMAFPEPFDGVFDALIQASQPALRDTISLARPIIIDNVGAGSGVALAATSAVVALGNGLIARNLASAGVGGVISAPNLSVINSTIADNPAGGLRVPAGSTILLGNTISLRNGGFNCSSGASISNAGRNFQFPESDCGSTIETRDPGLNGQYEPRLISAAHGVGIASLCVSDPLVRGVDLFGKARLVRGSCDSGAIEHPLTEDLASTLGFGSKADAVPRLLWLLVLLALIFFLLGLTWAFWRRKHPRPGGRRAAPKLAF